MSTFRGQAPVTQLRYCDIDRADTGVKVAVAVPIAVDGAFGGGNTVFRAAGGVSLGGEDLVDKTLAASGESSQGRIERAEHPNRLPGR